MCCTIVTNLIGEEIIATKDGDRSHGKIRAVYLRENQLVYVADVNGRLVKLGAAEFVIAHSTSGVQLLQEGAKA